jgi:predicted transcriptional regulator
MMTAMSRKRLPRPTDSELAILRVLWERGPATVRSVNESLPGAAEPGYTTTLKLMQIMVDKGLLTRDDSARSHVYSARVSRDQTQRELVDDLLHRAFGGSASALVMHALGAKTTSPAELAAIQKLIDEYRRKEPRT